MARRAAVACSASASTDAAAIVLFGLPAPPRQLQPHGWPRPNLPQRNARYAGMGVSPHCKLVAQYMLRTIHLMHLSRWETGGKGPTGHYAVWCDDLVQLPCTSTVTAPCDACASPHGCHALCLKNHTGGGACTAWSYNHQHKLCYLKGLADLPANATYHHVTGKPAVSADTSGHLWNYTVLLAHQSR